MSAPVITNLSPITEDATWTMTPYALEIKGHAEKRVTVTKHLNPENGTKMVRVIALATHGVPVQSLAMLDHIARTILPGARVQKFNKAANRFHREYSV